MTTLQDQKLIKLLNDRKAVADDLNVVVEQIIKLAKDRDEKAVQLDKSKNRIMAYVDKYIKPKLELGDFDEIGEIKIVPSGVEITKFNRVEDFKKAYLERKKKA
jgi:hypothetical protein